MKKLYSALVGIFFVGTALGQAGCPADYQPRPSQDCRAAIALCNVENSFDNSALCGRGAVEDNARGTCGTSEQISSWYQFQARRSGRLRFRIFPNDTTPGTVCNDYSGNCGSNQDYDFVLYKLPAGTVSANQTVCDLLGGTNNQYQVSCNFSGADGVTGLYDSLGAGPGRFEAPLQVNAGDFFILLVSNFRSTTVGYRIIFDDPDTDSQATDVRNTQEPPRLQSVTQVPTCANPRLIFSFNKPVLCQNIDPGTFGIVRIGDNAANFQVDAIESVTPCLDRTSTSQSFVIQFSPLQPSRSYAIVIRTPLTDICGNTTAADDTLRFSLFPFIRLEPFIGDVIQDSVCSGQPINLVATVDSNLRAPKSAFRFQFFEANGASRPPVVASPSGVPIAVDTNEVLLTQSFPVITRQRYKVIATNAATGCTDSSFVDIRINPNPIVQLQSASALCFGDQTTLQAVVDPVEGLKYNYRWTSRIGLSKYPNRPALTILADTVNFNAINTDSVKRGRNDDFTLNVSYKPQFGGCAVAPQRKTIAFGAYFQPAFAFDTVDRPGKTGSWVFPTLLLYDSSVIRSITNRNSVREIFTVGTGQRFIYSAPTDTFSVKFQTRGTYNIRLDMYDSVSQNLKCTKSFSKTVNIVYPEKPNLITKNGDNLNDFFEFPGLKGNGYRLIIANRWGRVVYKNDNYDNRFSGRDIASGIYYYKLEDTTNTSPSYKGWVEITDSN